MSTFTLSNGISIPTVGFGTAPLKGQEAYEAVKHALFTGYRHIDTAAIYLNEVDVGKAIKDSQIPRESLFITSKLDASIKSYAGAIEAYEASLKALDLTYLDLYLIHAPWPWDAKYSEHHAGNVAAFNALIDLYKAGKVRSIGVSNFDIVDLQNLQKHCEMLPHVNQIKCHVGHFSHELIQYCQAHGMLVEAYSPLGRAKILAHESLRKIADKHGVSPALVCIRYPLEKGVLPLPRSSNPRNIEMNLTLEFSLDSEDLKILDALTLESVEFGTPVQSNRN